MLSVADKFAKTDPGRQRKSNEDRFFSRPPLSAVADGMGGARAGEVASGMVVEALNAAVVESASAEADLAKLAREANQRIHQHALANPSQAGMGTTFTAAWVGEDCVSVAHVGDSRAYRMRAGHLELMTDDHSLVAELVRRGKLTEQEAEEHPQRSVITRALGPEPTVEVDTYSFPAQAGDLYLLCSDGLTSMVGESVIAELLRAHPEIDRAGQALIDEANQRGGRDNITVVLFRLGDVEGTTGSPAGPATTEHDQPTRMDLEGPTPEQVAAATAGAAPTATTAEARPPAPVPRRTAPLPPRSGAHTPVSPKRRRRVRGLGPALATLVAIALVAAGGFIATRAVHFVGAGPDGFVAVYRGLPYDLPLGLRLYERVYSSAVPVAELPPAGRGPLLNHRLRSGEDARDLVRKLELGQVGAPPPGRPPR